MKKVVSPEEILDILNDAMKIFDNEKIVVDIEARDIIFVGDIHGDINSATKIFRLIESTKSKFIFLGDYVDRGEYSTEVAIGLLRQKIKNPDRIILLRGNHETTLANEHYGFLSELQTKYHNIAMRLYIEFNKVFSQMPIAAIVNSEILALHGGIPKNATMTDIRKIKKGDIEGTNEILLQVLWNDPDETIDHFEQSYRGPGIYLYGKKAFEEFIKDAELKYIVRAHTFLIKGAQWFFNKRLLSIFSSINYVGRKVQAKIAKLKNKEIKVFDIAKI
ncbi:MAG: metallophosphoesterase [Candidatus Njordarchaeota archaeon]